jgi:hypothetical protein
VDRSRHDSDIDIRLRPARLLPDAPWESTRNIRTPQGSNYANPFLKINYGPQNLSMMIKPGKPEETAFTT